MERQEDTSTNFKVGDRVRLSKLGQPRFPRTDARVGTVVHIPDQKKGGRMWVRVLFDGRSTPMVIHRSYIEPASSAIGKSRPRNGVVDVLPVAPQRSPSSSDAQRTTARLNRPGSTSEILINCPVTGKPLQTGLDTATVNFGDLPILALPVSCPHCGQIHLWKPSDAWVWPGESSHAKN